MVEAYPPLDEVRKSFKIKWYRTPIEKDRMRELTRRSNLRGFFHAVGHLALVAATGTAVVLLFQARMWVPMAVTLWFHGIFYSFFTGLATHELSHGTVFRTKWLNEFFLRIYSMLAWVNFHHYRRSHKHHHMFTLHKQGDREAAGGRGHGPFRFGEYVRYFLFDWMAFWSWVSKIVGLAVTGEFKDEWSNALYPPEEADAKRKAVRWAQAVLTFHLAVLGVSIRLGLWMLPVVVSLGPFIATWWRVFIGRTMHNGLRDNVPDWRKCARTVKLDPLSRFLYWNMNYHIEHHMYAAVPCYNLPRLSKEVAWDFPKPRTIRDAWQEMRFVWKMVQTEPGYQWDTPVPNEGGVQDPGRVQDPGVQDPGRVQDAAKVQYLGGVQDPGRGAGPVGSNE
ncbi:MAG: fatty acid desaturase [Spirochaetota bacterium]